MSPYQLQVAFIAGMQYTLIPPVRTYMVLIKNILESGTCSIRWVRKVGFLMASVTARYSGCAIVRHSSLKHSRVPFRRHTCRDFTNHWSSCASCGIFTVLSTSIRSQMWSAPLLDSYCRAVQCDLPMTPDKCSYLSPSSVGSMSNTIPPVGIAVRKIL